MSELRSTLLHEQGFLCAYTMLRIKDARNGHIEHILARSRAPDAQIDYANMVYCHPGDGAPRCKFGAHAKDDAQILHEEFVSPLEETCETRFAYETGGSMVARNPNDVAASRTIELLALNDSDLQSQRRAAIRALAIFNRSQSRLSATEARKQASHLDQIDGEGRFRPFAPVLRQFLIAYAERRIAHEVAFARAARPAHERN